MEEYTPLEDFEYKIEDNNVLLIRYKKENQIVNIPNQYKIHNEYKNVKLATYSLEQNQEGIFESCINLKKIILPDTIKVIPDYCFTNCQKLKEVKLSNNLKEIGCFAFGCCYVLKEITIPKNIKTIPDRCFSECYELQNIKLPNNLKYIKQKSFSQCENLKKIQLPDNIIEIKSHAFELCEQLRTINIPKQIKQIETCVFENCNQLELNDFENQYIKIENNNIYQKEILFKNDILYHLTNCNQKNDTLILQEKETLDWTIENQNIKNIIIKRKEIEKLDNYRLINKQKINNLIFPYIKELDCNLLPSYIKNIYLSKIENITKSILCKIENIYINQPYSEIKKYKSKEYNIICQKTTEELLKNKYNFNQINQILKGQKHKNILFTNVNKDIDSMMLRDIINNFNYDDPKLYDILELLQKDNGINLENYLEIQEIINNKINYNIEKENTEIEKEVL